MNLSCIQEMFFKTNKTPINVSSQHGMHKSTKIRNDPTSYIHILVHIMLEVYLTDALSHQHIASSMVILLTGVPRNNLRPLEAVPTQKQEQSTQ